MDPRNFTYMFYGFAVVWGILAIYVVLLIAREKNLRKELDQLRSMIEDSHKK